MGAAEECMEICNFVAHHWANFLFFLALGLPFPRNSALSSWMTIFGFSPAPWHAAIAHTGTDLWAANLLAIILTVPSCGWDVVPRCHFQLIHSLVLTHDCVLQSN
jgi:hypothetical protein